MMAPTELDTKRVNRLSGPDRVKTEPRESVAPQEWAEFCPGVARHRDGTPGLGVDHHVHLAPLGHHSPGGLLDRCQPEDHRGIADPLDVHGCGQHVADVRLSLEVTFDMSRHPDRLSPTRAEVDIDLVEEIGEGIVEVDQIANVEDVGIGVDIPIADLAAIRLHWTNQSRAAPGQAV